MKHIISTFFLLLVFSNLAFAAENEMPMAATVGKVIVMEGAATIRHPSEASAVQVFPDMNVHMNDTIETMENSKLIVLFNDNSEITLGADASLTIDEYIFDPKNTFENAARFSILNGAFLLRSGFVSKVDDPDVVINTPRGSIGIRGTVVWGGPINEKYGVLVQEGLVEVQNSGGQTKVAAGEGTFMTSASDKPTEPKAWADETVQKAAGMVVLNNYDAITELLNQRKQDNWIAIKQATQGNKE